MRAAGATLASDVKEKEREEKRNSLGRMVQDWREECAVSETLFAQFSRIAGCQGIQYIANLEVPHLQYYRRLRAIAARLCVSVGRQVAGNFMVCANERDQVWNS